MPQTLGALNNSSFGATAMLLRGQAAGPHTIQDPGDRAASWERAAQRLPQEGIQISWGPGPGPLPTSLPQPPSPLLGP